MQNYVFFVTSAKIFTPKINSIQHISSLINTEYQLSSFQITPLMLILSMEFLQFQRIRTILFYAFFFVAFIYRPEYLIDEKNSVNHLGTMEQILTKDGNQAIYDIQTFSNRGTNSRSD